MTFEILTLKLSNSAHIDFAIQYSFLHLLRVFIIRKNFRNLLGICDEHNGYMAGVNHCNSKRTHQHFSKETSKVDKTSRFPYSIESSLRGRSKNRSP